MSIVFNPATIAEAFLSIAFNLDTIKEESSTIGSNSLSIASESSRRAGASLNVAKESLLIAKDATLRYNSFFPPNGNFDDFPEQHDQKGNSTIGTVFVPSLFHQISYLMAYISLDLSGYSNAVFADYGDNIINHMDRNPDYPALPVPGEVLRPKLVTFRTYLVDGDQISTYDRKQRDALRLDIQADLKRNGQYAIVLFPNDAAKQLAIGFPATKPKVKRTQPPNKPTNPRVRAGKQRGEAIFNCKKQPGTTSLNIHIYSNEPNPTSRTMSTTSGIGVLIKDLVPGRQYFFEVQAVGSKGPSDWAGPVDLFAA